jgi:hypothetical protein
VVKILKKFNDSPKQMQFNLLSTICVGIFSLFAVAAVVFGLAISIMNDVLKSTSIATSQYGDGLSLDGIYGGIICLGCLQFIALIGSLYAFAAVSKVWVFLICIFLINLLLVVPSETILFLFMNCFNFYNNGMVIARSTLVIISMVFLFVFPIFINSRFRTLTKSENWIVNLILNGFIMISALCVISFNIILLKNLRPQLNHFIQPSNIDMGYFDTSETVLLEKDNLSVTNSKLAHRFIGKLSDVIYSPNKVFSYRRCRNTGKTTSCTDYYMHTYIKEINCTAENQEFYKDCQDALSIRHVVKYLDDGPYPFYNCLVKKGNFSCFSNCTQLAVSNYRLKLVQQFNNRIEPAWTGLNNCKKPKIELTFDRAINPCISNDAIAYKHRYALTIFSILVTQIR